MLKVYGTQLCPDCVECKYNLDRNNIEYVDVDINKQLKNLKEFLRLSQVEHRIFLEGESLSTLSIYLSNFLTTL